MTDATSSSTPAPSSAPSPDLGAATGGIDPRGPRFVAGVTSLVLAIALVTGWWPVLGFQALMFAIASVFGVSAAPYGFLFRWFVRPRLGPPAEVENPAPVRFAQTVGLAVTGTGLILAALGVPAAVEVFSGLALIAAVLNASIGLCLGCEMYLRLNHLRVREGQ